MKISQVIINGKILPTNSASLGIDDLSIVRGYAIFDYFKTIDNRAIFLEDNLDRFYHSAKQMDLIVPFSRDQIREQIYTLMKVNDIPSSGIKILLTGGYSIDGYTITTPNVIITQSELNRNLTNEQNGIRLITFPYHRPFGTVKSIDYVMGIQALKKARKQGADDVVYALNNQLSECPRANIFIVDQFGTVITPEKDILAGITRKHVIEIAKNITSVEIRDVSLEDMANASEAFITSTTKNITPVIAIDDIKYGSSPGQVTTRLQEAFEVLTFKNYGVPIVKA